MAIASKIAKKSQLNTSNAKNDSAFSIVIFFSLYKKKRIIAITLCKSPEDLYNITNRQISSIFMPILLANSTKFGKDV